MNIVSAYRLLAAGLLVTAGLQPAAAEPPACFDPAPLRAQLGDDYWAVDVPRSRLPAAPGEMNALAANLGGQWHGEATGFDCRGTDGNPRRIPRQALITATFSGSAENGLVIDFSRERVEQKITTHDSTVLFHPHNLLHFEITGPSRLVGSERFRQGTAEGLSVLRQTSARVEQHDNQLTLQRHYYVNGVLVGADTWHLTRR